MVTFLAQDGVWQWQGTGARRGYVSVLGLRLRVIFLSSVCVQPGGVRKVIGAVVHGTEQESCLSRPTFPLQFCWSGMVLSGSFAVEQQDQRLLKSPWTLVSSGAS